MNKEDFNKILGESITAIREKKDLSKRRLSINIDKDYHSILRLEQGKLNPSYYFLLEISKGLGVSIAELTKGLK